MATRAAPATALRPLEVARAAPTATTQADLTVAQSITAPTQAAPALS